jgi:cyclic pyranopterin phosphate synthase
MYTEPASDTRLERFHEFNRLGGKFRVAVINLCNLDCFFCHNEGMANPRRQSALSRPRAQPQLKVLEARLSDDDLHGMIEAYAELGGAQINLTGGEPLARTDIVPWLHRLRRGGTRTVLNTNALLADRLLAVPKLPTLDAIFASLHTTDEERFRSDLGGRNPHKVMENIAALRRHGYEVQVNYSLGPHNLHQFDDVLTFILAEKLNLKVIALVRFSDEPEFYRGDWLDPDLIEQELRARGAVYVREENTVGGHKTTWQLGDSTVLVKNIGRGRLRTDFCSGCSQAAGCGEGIYGQRVGVDALFKPCLLRKDGFIPVDRSRSYREQILDAISAMMGEGSRAQFVAGSPQ